MYDGGMTNDQFQQTQQTQPQEQAEIFDEEAFARAFDAATTSEFATEEASLEREEVLPVPSPVRIMTRDPALDQERIGADLIHDPDGSATQHDSLQQDADALSRTAGELLHKVQNDHSDKFQNSQFLQLMRQLRDKEVTVEGDKLVDINGSVEVATP